MLVYKFGGASVRSYAGVRNLHDIIIASGEAQIVVIVSAMGKTTNNLEKVTAAFIEGNCQRAISFLEESIDYHREICAGLLPAGNSGEHLPTAVQQLFRELRHLLTTETPSEDRYDYWYDRIVSYGELISTTIVCKYLNTTQIDCHWLDIRRCFVTDNRHRDANIDIPVSAKLLTQAVHETFDNPGYKIQVVITQGFIGATADGQTTTLGREGSDYSAAVAANILDAESLTIWKDVDGILNADPKFFSGTSLIPEMNYLDAIELAYSGAQVIHPKTIKPLKSKGIPLLVRPFMKPALNGSRINGRNEKAIDVPVLILKKNQVLISVRPHDFSFVIEEKLPEIFALTRRYGIRMNLIQSSAVNLSLCVDQCRGLSAFGDELRKDDFRVVYNEGLELLTIRGYDDTTYDKHTCGLGVYLVQKTRRIVRVVRQETPAETCLEV